MGQIAKLATGVLVSMLAILAALALAYLGVLLIDAIGSTVGGMEWL